MKMRQSLDEITLSKLFLLQSQLANENNWKDQSLGSATTFKDSVHTEITWF